MAGKSIMRARNLPTYPGAARAITYLTEGQFNDLVEVFRAWYDEAPTDYARKTRGRYWLTFLALRFTGARLGEVLMIDDTRDVDHRTGELRLATLKKKRAKPKTKREATDIPHPRQIPVPMSVTSEVASFQAQFPEIRGQVFKLKPGNFRAKFYEMAGRAGIPKELGHPHILRHSRAVELLRGGVPIKVVKDMLGHSSILVTSVYLTISGRETCSILRDKGFL